MTTPARESLSHAFLVGLVDILDTGLDADGFLSNFVARSVVLLGMDSAAVLLADRTGTLEVAASSGEPARTVSTLEISRGKGPSIDAHQTGRACWHPVDPTLTEHWPDLAETARHAGITVLLVAPMRRREKTIGVLTLLGDRHTQLGVDTLQLARSLAEAATIGMLNLHTIRQHERTAAQLQTALASRIVIEQAKGVIAGRLGVTVGEAFTLLRDNARAHSRNLHTFAQEVIDGQVQITRD